MQWLLYKLFGYGAAARWWRFTGYARWKLAALYWTLRTLGQEKTVITFGQPDDMLFFAPGMILGTSTTDDFSNGTHSVLRIVRAAGYGALLCTTAKPSKRELLDKWRADERQNRLRGHAP